jgi:hypothetical protein
LLPRDTIEGQVSLKRGQSGGHGYRAVLRFEKNILP